MSESIPRKVVLIGCDPEIAELMRLVLTRQNPNWDCAYVEAARAGIAQAASDPPDLIIVQIMMADMDGFVACAQIKQDPRLRSVPVLLQAAMKAEQVYPDAQKCGAAGYLLQPWAPQTLVAACEAALRGETFYPPL